MFYYVNVRFMLFISYFGRKSLRQKTSANFFAAYTWLEPSKSILMPCLHGDLQIERCSSDCNII